MNKVQVEKDMDEVIATSKKIRDELMNLENKGNLSGRQIQTYNTILNTNKNIVSASIVKISVEKLK